jgi:hypothetical protein
VLANGRTAAWYQSQNDRFGWKAAGPLSDVNAEKQTSPSRAFPTFLYGSKNLLAGNLIRRCDQV